MNILQIYDFMLILKQKKEASENIQKPLSLKVHNSFLIATCPSHRISSLSLYHCSR